MDGLVWFADRYTWLVHLPVAAALMIPFPIIAAQRAGRGIRPWWTTCRFLAWAGLASAILAALSGFLSARHQGLLPQGILSDPSSLPALFRVHAYGGAASVLLGAVCLRSLYRQRREHQGIGLIALMFGLLWGGCALITSYDGSLLMGPVPGARFSLPPPALLAASQLPGPRR